MPKFAYAALKVNVYLAFIIKSLFKKCSWIAKKSCRSIQFLFENKEIGGWLELQSLFQPWVEEHGHTYSLKYTVSAFSHTDFCYWRKDKSLRLISHSSILHVKHTHNANLQAWLWQWKDVCPVCQEEQGWFCLLRRVKDHLSLVNWQWMRCPPTIMIREGWLMSAKDTVDHRIPLQIPEALLRLILFFWLFLSKENLPLSPAHVLVLGVNGH